MAMGTMKAGDGSRWSGPLGTPTHIETLGHRASASAAAPASRRCCPSPRALKAAGNRVLSILGGRTKELVILRPEMTAASHEMIFTTDDGCFGRKGLVTHALTDLIAERGKPEPWSSPSARRS